MEGRGEDIPVRSRRAYQRAQQIGIMNYWVYFNQNPVVDPAALVVMDDAHLAEHCLHSLYSVMISRNDHKLLFEQLVSELHKNFPEYAVLADAVSDDAPPETPAELLSFIDHEQIANRLKEIIDSSSILGSDTDLNFRWKRMRPRIHRANLYIGCDSLWIRPYIYPLINNTQYQKTDQVLYMSATIGDPGDLSRRLGVRPIQKIHVPNQFAEQRSGRRLIIMNRTNDDSDIPSRMEKALLQAISLHPKSVWLCSSEREATQLRNIVTVWLEKNGMTGHPTWLLTPLGDEIDQFRQAPTGHLFVAGRFDGMDFNDDQCRIVVLVTMPKAINLQEEFIAYYLRDSGFMRRRLNQRVVQGLGRCTRNDKDFGVYFLADQRFATHFSRESNREGIPQHIMAEIDLAQDLSERDDVGLATYVAQFLKKNFEEYDADLSQLAADIPQPQKPENSVTATSKDEVIGWTALFESENYAVAQDHFERCWNSAKNDNLLEIAALQGWHRAKALYLDGLRGQQGASDQAIQVLEEAIKRGGQSSWFNRMRASISRMYAHTEPLQAIAECEFAETVIRSFDDGLERLGVSGNKYQKFINGLNEKLGSEKHATYQEGLETLGTLLGYKSFRPKNNAAADCIWRGNFGNTRELFTFEIKIEHQPSNSITASDLGQASLQYNRAMEEYSNKGYVVHSLIATHLEQIAPEGVSSIGQIKLISKDTVLALWACVCNLMTLYRSRWNLDVIQMRRAAEIEIRPKLPKTGWLLRAVASADPWLSENMLLKEWNE